MAPEATILFLFFLISKALPELSSDTVEGKLLELSQGIGALETGKGLGYHSSSSFGEGNFSGGSRQEEGPGPINRKSQ